MEANYTIPGETLLVSDSSSRPFAGAGEGDGGSRLEAHDREPISLTNETLTNSLTLFCILRTLLNAHLFASAENAAYDLFGNLCSTDIVSRLFSVFFLQKKSVMMSHCFERKYAI